MKKTNFCFIMLCVLVFCTFVGYAEAVDIDMSVNVGEKVILPEIVEYDNLIYNVVWDKKSVNTDTTGVIHIKGECNGLDEYVHLYIFVKNNNTKISDIERKINYTEKNGNFAAEITGSNKIAVLQIYKQNNESVNIDNAVYTEAIDISNSKADFDVNLSEFESGKYIAVISSGDLSDTLDFVWLDSDGFIKSIKEMTEDENIGNNLLDLYNEYSPIIETELKESFETLDTAEKEQILKNLYTAVKKMSDVTFEKVTKELDRQTAFLIFLNSDDMTAFLEQKEPPYCEILGLDTSADGYYGRLLDKTFVNAYIQSSSLVYAEDLQKAFYEGVAVASLNQAERGDVYNILNNLYNVNELQIIDIKEELSKLNSEQFSETEKNQIWAKMALKTDYTTPSSVKKKLNEEINIVLSSRKANTGGGSGGGSSFTSNSAGNYSSGNAVQVTVPAELEKDASDMFEDLDEAQWAREYIINLYERGVVNGDEGKFRPNDAVTRAEFSAILSRAMKLEAVSVTQKNFTDVNENAWYADYVYALAQCGIIQGVDELHFNPDGYLTREDMCVLVYRALKHMEKISSVTEVDEFSDSSQISDYAKPAVKYLQSINAINGMENNLFMPKTISSRAMICKVVCDIIV